MHSPSAPALSEATFIGNPCKHGHTTRYVFDRGCAVCRSTAAKRKRLQNPEATLLKDKKRREKIKHRPQVWASHVASDSRKRARVAGIPHTISTRDVLAAIPSDFLCPVLGIPLEFGRTRRGPGTPSLDQFIPNAGYTVENIRVISWRANELKRNVVDPDELQKVVGYIRKGNAPNALHQRASESGLNAFSCYPASELSLPC